MKKLLSLAVLALTSFGLQADLVVDTFDVSTVLSGASEDQTYSGTFTGEGTGATYNYNGLVFNSGVANMNFGKSSYIKGDVAGYTLKKVERIGGSGVCKVFAAAEDIQYSSRIDSPFSSTLSVGGSVDVTDDYAYVMVVNNAAYPPCNVSQLKFYWEKKAPVGPTTASDDINIAAFKAQFPDFTYNSPYSTPVVNPDCELVFENGGKYEFKKMCGGWTGTDVDHPWWMLDTDGYFTVSEPAHNMWIESVEVKADNWSNQISMAFGNEKLTPENYNTAGEYEDYINLENHQLVKKPLAPSKYFYFNKTKDCYYDIIVNWTSEMPVYQVATPVIENYDEQVTNASNVQIRLPYNGAQIKLEVYVKEAGAADYTLDANLSKTYDERSLTIPMPGKAGAMVKFVAVGVRENCQDSEPAEVIYGPLEMADATAPQLIVNGTYVADPREADRVYVTPGSKFSVVVGERVYNQEDYSETMQPIEGATVKYQYTVKDANGETVSTGDEVTATTNPAEVTVPATVVPGQKFAITATSVIPDRKDKSLTFDLSIISDVLDAPTFSLPSGSDVVKGGKVQIIKPHFADSIFWTVNGGEVNGESWGPQNVVIDAETVIEAWATSKNLKPSERVTATFNVEVLEAWMDEIVPGNFVDGTDWQQYAAEDRNYASTNTDVTYLYNGRFMTDWSKPLDEGSSEYAGNFDLSSPTYYLTNTTAYNKKGETQIKSIKVECKSFNKVYVAFANEAFEAPTADSDICKEDYSGTVARVSVRGSEYDGKADYASGQWIDLKGLKNIEGDGTEFFMVFAGAGNYPEVSRVVVHYWDPKDGVGSIVTEDVEGAVYSINGYRVNSENLTPGVYVRKQNGKTVKFVVK